MVEHLPCDEGIRLLLTPNRSISWQGSVRVWLALCGVSLLVVSLMIWLGAWVVLPFAGLELAAVGAGLYYTARKCRQQEVLEIVGDNLRLEKGLYRKEAEWEMPRRYLRVRIEVPNHPWTPQKFFLTYRGTEVSLASFLNVDDAKKLLGILESQGLPFERRRHEYTGFWF